jgi:hypothetical protein
VAKRSVKAAPARTPRAKAAGSRTRVPVVKLAAGQTVALDGDLVYLIDALYREFAVRRGFAAAYSDVQEEIGRLLDQMGAGPTREYFAASLFLNYVTYENEMAERLAEAITRKARRAARR